jgi:hypothetical protein
VAEFVSEATKVAVFGTGRVYSITLTDASLYVRAYEAALVPFNEKATFESPLTTLAPQVN